NIIVSHNHFSEWRKAKPKPKKDEKRTPARNLNDANDVRYAIKMTIG
ncbi:1312_t:CDS:1, partial [Racocetra persica]